VDATFCLETSAQRSWHAVANREQSVSRLRRPITFERDFIVTNLRLIGDNAWWKREPVGEWLPGLSADNPQFRRLLESMDWLDE
jgi:hypothetical protein